MKSIELAKKLDNKIVNNKSIDKNTDNMNLLNKKRKESNNNQRTVNINSFSNLKNSNENIDKKKQIKMRNNDKNRNKLKDDEEYIYQDDEESDDDENEEIEEYNFDEESLENELMDIKMNNYKYINSRNKNLNNNKEKLRLKYKKRKLVRGLYLNSDEINNKSETFSENNSEINDEKSEEINKIIQKLVNYQIQIFNTQNQKLIIKELDNLQIAMKNNENINDNYNELYKVLSTFTYNKNSEIVLKSTDLLSNLTYKIINDLFSLSDEEKDLILKNKQNIEKDDEYEYLEIKKLSDLILNKNNSLDEMSINSKKDKNKKIYNEDNNVNDNNDKLKSNNENLSDNIINIIINNLNENFIQISDDFFKNIYNKKDNGLDINLAIKRKSACIKLLSLCKKTFPKLDEEYLKTAVESMYGKDTYISDDFNINGTNGYVYNSDENKYIG